MKKSLFFLLASLLCLPGIVSGQFERLELQKQKQVDPKAYYGLHMPDTLPGLGKTPPDIEFNKILGEQVDSIRTLQTEMNKQKKPSDPELLEKINLLMKQIEILESEELNRQLNEAKNIKSGLDTNYKRLVKVQTLLEKQNGDPLHKPETDNLHLDTFQQFLMSYYLDKEKADVILINAIGDSLYKNLTQVAVALSRSKDKGEISDDLRPALNECTRLVKQADKLITSINTSRLQASKVLEQRRKEIEKKSEKDTSSQAHLDGLMSTIIPLTSAVIVPSVNIRASRKIDTKHSETRRSSFNAFLFVAPTTFANRDTSYSGIAQKAKNSLLIPEMSDFGFKCAYSLGGKYNSGSKAPGWGLTLSGYYLNKNIPVSNEQQGIAGYQSVGYCHFVQGVGLNFLGSAFEVYANCNQLIPLHGANTYQQFFSVDSKPRVFLDMGVSALLNMNGKDSKTYLLTRIGFIVNNGQINSFMAQNDKVLAIISISLKPDF